MPSNRRPTTAARPCAGAHPDRPPIEASGTLALRPAAAAGDGADHAPAMPRPGMDSAGAGPACRHLASAPWPVSTNPAESTMIAQKSAFQRGNTQLDTALCAASTRLMPE